MGNILNKCDAETRTVLLEIMGTDRVGTVRIATKDAIPVQRVRMPWRKLKIVESHMVGPVQGSEPRRSNERKEVFGFSIEDILDSDQKEDVINSFELVN
jgi:hypothetical protein